jgi:mono/diheme cytochrome c family protein
VAQYTYALEKVQASFKPCPRRRHLRVKSHPETPMRAITLRLLALVPLPLIAAGFGGWAAVTVEDLPDYVVSQQPIRLAFMIRQHGVRPLEGLSPLVEARSGGGGGGGGGSDTTFAAEPAGETGRYAASVTLPEPGRWTLTIHSGFGRSSVSLLPLDAVAPGAAAPAPLAAAERGRRLFVAKGCVTCHLNRAVNETSIGVGPELTGRRFAPEYLARFLADPAAVIPPPPGQFGMPNLRLRPAEIAALTAFLNGGGQEVSR